MSNEEIIERIDDLIRTAEQLKCQLTTRQTKRRSDIPHFDEWEREKENKWSITVDHYKIVIFRRHDGSYHWYIWDRRDKLRIAANRKAHHTKRAARGRVTRYYEDCISRSHR